MPLIKIIIGVLAIIAAFTLHSPVLAVIQITAGLYSIFKGWSDLSLDDEDFRY